MRQLFLLLVVGVALVVLWAQHVAMLTSVGHLVVEETPLGPADAVFALGQTPGIAEEAAAIVRAGQAPRVVLFTSPSNEGEEVLTRLGVDVPSPHEVVVKVLRAAGVAAQRITVIPHDPDGTNAEVRQIVQYARSHGISRLIVVTFRSHTRRTARLLRQEMPAPGAVMVRAAPRDSFKPESWWRDRGSARELAMEALRWGNSFVLRDFWGREAGVAPARLYVVEARATS